MARTVEELAQHLLQGAAKLNEGHVAEATALLKVVATDPDLQHASDLTDVRARACSLYAQALLGMDDVEEAEAWIQEALRITRPLGDMDGLRVLRGLHSEIMQRKKERQTQADEHVRSIALAEMPVHEIVANARSPYELAQRLVERAQAAVEVGRLEEALSIAQQAQSVAVEHQMTRERVLAHIILARVEPHKAQEILEAALAVARQDHEVQLIALIAKTAKLFDLQLEPHELPHRTSS
jgi:tetratricopeptide (TPR) repeat protein